MNPLVARMVQGDGRAVARAMTVLENDSPDAANLRAALMPYRGMAQVVGITGSPGAGKSSLVDGLVYRLRDGGQKVGVLAVDPSSPFTGGALLGDRVRMGRHSGHPNVYIRSVGARGQVGGLTASVSDLLLPLQAYGCKTILLETVGAGQSELDVMTVADTVVVVLTPGAGDAVQIAKAGIMEIADILVVNKSDLPGADAFTRDLEFVVHGRGSGQSGAWTPPVIRTEAVQAVGVEDLWTAVLQHQANAVQSGDRDRRRRHRMTAEIIRFAGAEYMRRIEPLVQRNGPWYRSSMEAVDTREMARRIVDDSVVLPSED